MERRFKQNIRYDTLDESVSHLSSMATANYTALNFILLLLSIFNNYVESYHAVVVIHGVLTGSDSMELISNRIQEVSNSNVKQRVLQMSHLCKFGG